MTSIKSEVYVKSAQGLKDVSNKVIAQTFVDCVDVIFNYTDDSISSILTSKGTTHIKSIWVKLIALLQDKHAPCAEKNPLPCKQNKKDIITDICLIGRCLTAPEQNQSNQIEKCLDLLFVKETLTEEPEVDLSTNENLINYVKQLQSQIDALKKEGQDHKDCIKILKTEIINLKTEVKSCKTTINKFKPNLSISDYPLLNNNSDGNDSDNESEASENPELLDCDLESVISEIPIPKIKPKKKQNLVWVNPSYSDIFIGRLHPKITEQNIKDRLLDEHNTKVSIADIKKLPTVSKCNAFKITVLTENFDQAITGWPNGIKAERYSVKKPSVYPNRNTNKSYRGANVRTNNRGFRNQKPRFSPGDSYWNSPDLPEWTDQFSFRPNGRY